MSLRRRFGLVLLGALVQATLLGAALSWYSLWLPGKGHVGPLPALRPDEQDLAIRLRQHVVAVASEPHNLDYPQAYEHSAAYIERTLSGHGRTPERQIFEVDARPVRNIWVTLGRATGSSVRRTIVVGAHYDSFANSPGANDNGTGTAAVLELARMLADMTSHDARLILVLFANEEPPYFRTPDMGSVHFAKLLADRKEPVVAMLALETMGYFSEHPRSQRYPEPFGRALPSTANFVAFVAMPGSRDLLHSVVGSFRRTTSFPSVGGVAPGIIPGIDYSDHWAFAQAGFQALMITDTALFRYPHYHKTSDTPDKIDYERLARVTKGIERAVRDLTGSR